MKYAAATNTRRKDQSPSALRLENHARPLFGLILAVAGFASVAKLGLEPTGLAHPPQAISARFPVAAQPTTVGEASEPNSLRADRQGNPGSPNRSTRSMSTVTVSPPVSAPSERDDSLTQSSTLGANGKIAFSRTNAFTRTSVADIYIMNADGSSQIKLTNSEFGADPAPAWSPDGTRIAFASGPRGNSEISVMNRDGSNRTRLTNHPARDSNPDWSPDSTRIVFTSLRNVLLNPEIYVMNADGSSQINLTDNPGWDESPAWSPDGTRIAFARGLVGNVEIYVMNADGSNQTRLTNSGFDSNPAWSPDGTRIAFASSRDGNAEIYLMNADGSNQTRLTNNPAGDSDPAWSPDGARIAFATGGQIYVINTDGSSQTRLTNTPVGFSQQPDWSPAGTRIVFTTFQTPNPEINPGIYVMNPDGSNQTRLTNSEFDSDPAWSPDGTRIAFTSSGNGNAEIYVMTADGSNQMNLTNNPAGDGSPAWSPDGARIAFASDRDSNLEIYVMNADGSNQTRLTNSTFVLGSSDPTWSPDGTRIAFGTFQEWNDQFAPDEIYVMNADGSSQINLTNDPGLDGEPTWSPDGARIAFTRQQVDDLEIYVMNADGSNQTRLTNGPHSYGPAWSPDSTRIAFTSNQDSNAAPAQIYVMNINGSNQTRLTNNPAASSSGPAWQALPTTTANPIDSAAFFVRQHYLDFLNREPDQGGWDYWTARITECGNDPLCVHQRRIDVSGAFFVELEFQDTGYVVYRLHRAAHGVVTTCFGPDEFQCDETCSEPCEPRSRAKVAHSQFVADRAQLVGGPGLPQSTINFANNFVQRPEFKQAYPEAMTPSDFVNKLFDTANLTGSANASLRQAAIDALTNGSKTRAQVLLDVIEISEFKTREYNRAFVLMQYFGYLRRDPDEGGYYFWLDVLNNREPNNYRGMVCAFITSAEYQLRFGSAVTRTNQDCAQ